VFDCPSVEFANEPERADQAEAADTESKPTARLYGTLNRRLNDVADIRRSLSWPHLLKQFLYPPTKFFRRLEMAVSTGGLVGRRVSRAAFDWHELFEHRKAHRGFRLYEKLASPPKDGEPFVYYPLHFEPERTTVPEGRRLTDQPDVIRRLADALPAGWKVYVKEHPRQFRRGVLWSKARNEDFYRRLAADSRIRLVSLDVSSEQLVAEARVAATITGTSGWEALSAGVPAIAFGYPWYRNAPGLRTVDGDADCRLCLDDAAAGRWKVDVGKVAAFAAALTRSATFRGCFSDKILAISQLNPEENGRLFAEAIEARLAGRDPYAGGEQPPAGRRPVPASN
jgi:hypothetical protein